MGSPRIPHSSEFVSVIYGLLLLLGTPILIHVFPSPGYLGSATQCCQLSCIPSVAVLWAPYLLCSAGDTSEFCFPADTSSPSCLQSPQRRGMKGAGRFSGNSTQPGLVRSLLALSFLSFLILFPRNILRTSPVTLVMSLWVGEMAVHSCLELRRARSMAKAGRCQEPDPLRGLCWVFLLLLPCNP